MKVLVIGSGGREHALVWKIRQSPRVSRIFCAPGNGGIASLAECVDIKADNIPALLRFAQQEKIDLTVVGPEVPLVLGIVDAFLKSGLKIFGPSTLAAQLEGSKVFAKDFMARHGVPTARYRSFSQVVRAREGLKDFSFPVVIKADGLAAGKGVIICESRLEAENALTAIMTARVFKDAGDRVVIEEFLVGEEASILAVADGKDFIIFPVLPLSFPAVILESSQDHKRIFDGDKGPNTGGMGAYSPAPVVTPALMKEISDTVIKPMIDGMAREEMPFKGILYAGIMITKQGIKVLEFNTRFGDPETEAVLPRLKSDLVDVMLASIEGRLKDVKLEWDAGACVCVVMAARGYPGEYSPGDVITGLDTVSADAVVFHAGTKKEGDKILTSGGRVLGVTSKGNSISEAITNVYREVKKISFRGCQYRQDIGKKALNR
ncbi:MAG: phosphoribosylamine--glycine ligase [Candidatus Omnitrophica bacterium]|nr:phosphoribosylamine--glycine ligase [Candidatus Omnitrophota bacterium]